MSISRKVLRIVSYVKSITERKSFKTVFISISAFVLFLGVFNVYAQESAKIGPDWEGTKELHNILNGTDPDEDNMNSRQGLEGLNTAWTILQWTAPELTVNFDKLEGNANVPQDLKKGLLGITRDAGNTVYANYPNINVGQHLADNWIPGHKESTISTYAANSSVGHPSGYEELMNSGIVGMWNRVLNLSYVFFVVVMLGAGFMIMFRHKLGGQTMVTLGNVLPGIVLALIVATFSFAIAGLIIDIGGIVTGLVAYILGDGYEVNAISGLFKLMFGAFSPEVMIQATSLGDILKIGGILGILSAFTPIVGLVGILGILLTLIIVAVVFVGAVKVLIVLYKAYFSLLISVILGPIQITLGAFPGNRHTMINWILSILRNVLVFPVVLFIINIPNLIAMADTEVQLNFPGKLVYEDPSTYNPAGIVDASGMLFIFILRIFVLYFAAQAPKFLEAWLPANTPKPIQEGMLGVRASLSKVPLVGGLFK